MDNEIKTSDLESELQLPESAAIVITVINTNEHESKDFQLFGSSKHLFSDKFLKDGSLLSIDGVHVQSYNKDISYRDMLCGVLKKTLDIGLTYVEIRNELYPNLKDALKIEKGVHINTIEPVFGNEVIKFMKFSIDDEQVQLFASRSNVKYLINGFTTLNFPALAPKAELKITFYGQYKKHE